MWCHICEQASFAKKTTIRITDDGHEVLIQVCGLCNGRSETEYFKGKTVSITDEEPKGKKKIKKNISIRVKKGNAKKLSRSIKKTSLGDKLR